MTGFRKVGFVAGLVVVGVTGPLNFPYPWDTMESYTDGDLATGQSGGGGGWAAAWLTNVPGVQDDVESYSDGANVAGLNGGIGWVAAYTVI